MSNKNDRHDQRREGGERKERSLWAGENRQEEEFDASLEGERIRKGKE